MDNRVAGQPPLVEVRGAPAPSHETPAPDNPDRPPRPYLLTTLALLTTITAITSSLGAPLVPSVVEHFDVRLTTAQWSLTAALLAGAVSTPVVGRFASGRVRRPTILAGLTTVLLGTVLAAAAVPLGSFALLVAARVPGAADVPRTALPPGRLSGQKGSHRTEIPGWPAPRQGERFEDLPPEVQEGMRRRMSKG